MERLGTESDSSIKVDSDLSMEIDPPPPLRENVATAEDWRRALGRVVPAVVVLRTNACRAFDTKRLEMKLELQILLTRLPFSRDGKGP